MDKQLARKIINERMKVLESGCWTPHTKTREVRWGGEMLSFAYLVSIGWDKTNTSSRPYRTCDNSWCYNPDHLLYSQEERFFAYVDIRGEDECWNWTRSKDGGGYGSFFCPRFGKEKSHRVSWMITNGEIPDGLYVCHKCDNPSCVNPNHLFLGTNQDNMTDKVSKNRQTRMAGILNGRAIASSSDVIKIREEYASGTTSYSKLVKKYGISQTQIARIIKKESWSWLE